MTSVGYLRWLPTGTVVNCTYRRGELAGLTWEECRDGDQYDEHAYTRDERHQFGTADEVLERPGSPSPPSTAG